MRCLRVTLEQVYLALHWQCHCDQRQCDAGQNCLDRHPPRLPSYLSELGLVLDLFYLAREIARTARSEPYSGFVSPLKEA